MEIAKIEVNRADARKVYCGTLTAGMVGVKVSFSFDAAWSGLQKLATFTAGSTAKDVVLTGDVAEIPWEALEKPWPRLAVGVRGVNDAGTLVIPTVWAELGNIIQGAKPSGQGSAAATPEAWAQILAMIGDLKGLNTEAKNNLVAAVNEVLTNSGGADPAEIQRIVEEYLEENGVGGGIHVGDAAPTDPNVDIWVDTSEEEASPYIQTPAVAKVGQTIRVAAVDASGKPVAWDTVKLPSAPADVGAIPAPAAAEVGQYFRISAVDEAGNVTAVEAVEAPTGGGEEVWETIIDYTVPEDCVSVTLKTDINGSPFSLKKAIATIVLYPLADFTTSAISFTTDSSRADNPYSANTFRHGLCQAPTEANKYSYLRIELVKTPTGVWHRGIICANNVAITDGDAYTGGRVASVHEDIDVNTLESYVKDIAAIGIGSYQLAIGAGTRIVMVGVRE